MVWYPGRRIDPPVFECCLFISPLCAIQGSLPINLYYPNNANMSNFKLSNSKLLSSSLRHWSLITSHCSASKKWTRNLLILSRTTHWGDVSQKRCLCNNDIKMRRALKDRLSKKWTVKDIRYQCRCSPHFPSIWITRVVVISHLPLIHFPLVGR